VRATVLVFAALTLLNLAGLGLLLWSDDRRIHARRVRPRLRPAGPVLLRPRPYSRRWTWAPAVNGSGERIELTVLAETREAVVEEYLRVVAGGAPRATYTPP
jgi:hypothetical protein